jgi:rare lipoprotein A
MGRPLDKAGDTSTAPPPSPTTSTDIFIQVGAFSSRDNAEQLRERLTSQFDQQNVAAAFHDETRLYRVRIGPLDTRDQADRLIRQLIDGGLSNPRLVLD